MYNRTNMWGPVVILPSFFSPPFFLHPLNRSASNPVGPRLRPPALPPPVPPFSRRRSSPARLSRSSAAAHHPRLPKREKRSLPEFGRRCSSPPPQAGGDALGRRRSAFCLLHRSASCLRPSPSRVSARRRPPPLRGAGIAHPRAAEPASSILALQRPRRHLASPRSPAPSQVRRTRPPDLMGPTHTC
ncbi:hypothetical protein PVAP13_1KG037500 [Panicum virgatum]|uniref:Uncharacterized protein n=1 Tax=Panicum virgatum TaxID=38727 RepID=A0A8T0XAQ5_PANVG|nr:hypothetical protein PVAP13_1KG037500 [Panicum virgatum]